MSGADYSKVKEGFPLLGQLDSFTLTVKLTCPGVIGGELNTSSEVAFEGLEKLIPAIEEEFAETKQLVIDLIKKELDLDGN